MEITSFQLAIISVWLAYEVTKLDALKTEDEKRSDNRKLVLMILTMWILKFTACA